MRGKASLCSSKYLAPRITPAHAGKRECRSVRSGRSRDHPRACGEKQELPSTGPCGPGSPPRMRGKAKDALFLSVLWGITPAHAGKSLQKFAVCRVSQDHPRACGEKKLPSASAMGPQGSPPRMRGKGCVFHLSPPLFRITPAHAGKSP